MILETKLPGTFAAGSAPKASSPAHLEGRAYREGPAVWNGRTRQTLNDSRSIDGGAALPGSNQIKQHTATV
jgi:hypothetical protein